MATAPANRLRLPPAWRGLSFDDLVAMMRATPLLAEVRDAVVEALLDQGTCRTFRRGTYLFHQGDAAHSVFLLCRGRIEISALTPQGHKQLLTTIAPPQVFGELGVVGDQPRHGAAFAVVDSFVWEVSGDVFLGLLAAEPEAALALLRALARQVHAYGALVDDLLFLDLRARVAKRLLGLVSATPDRPPPAGTVVPAITQADLASLAGGSRENVSRILAEFQRRGVVAREKGRYVIVDPAALHRQARL